jgi:hypothetical protein
MAAVAHMANLTTLLPAYHTSWPLPLQQNSRVQKSIPVYVDSNIADIRYPHRSRLTCQSHLKGIALTAWRVLGATPLQLPVKLKKNSKINQEFKISLPVHRNWRFGRILFRQLLIFLTWKRMQQLPPKRQKNLPNYATSHPRRPYSSLSIAIRTSTLSYELVKCRRAIELVASFLAGEAWVQSKAAHAGCVERSDKVTTTWLT